MCSCDDAVEDRRLDHRRGDAVDDHACAREVLSDRLRHRDDRGLGRRVGGGHRVPLLARDRGDVDDPPVAALDHARDDRAVAVEDAVGVDPHDTPPLLVRDVDGRQRRARHACRADEDVDGSELVLARARPLPSTSAELGDVAGQREHVVRCLGREIEGRDARTLGEQASRDGRADPARPARDERHLSREALCVAHGSRPSLESGRRGLRSDQRLPARDTASGPRVDPGRHPARRASRSEASAVGSARRRRDSRDARDASDAG